MLHTVTDGYVEEELMDSYSDWYRGIADSYTAWLDDTEPCFDDDQLIKELDNEVVEEDEEEWGAWLKEGERPVSNG